MYRFIITLVVIAGLTAAPAFAQESVRGGYGGTADVLGEVGEVDGTDAAPQATPQAPPATPAAGSAPTSAPVPAPTEATGSSQLPFTGLDVALLAAGGLVLLATGLGVRRIAARPRLD